MQKLFYWTAPPTVRLHFGVRTRIRRRPDDGASAKAFSGCLSNRPIQNRQPLQDPTGIAQTLVYCGKGLCSVQDVSRRLKKNCHTRSENTALRDFFSSDVDLTAVACVRRSRCFKRPLTARAGTLGDGFIKACAHDCENSRHP